MGRKMQGRQGPGRIKVWQKQAPETGENQEAGQVLRGFVSGGAWGLMAAALGLTTASMLAPQPAGNAPPQEPLVVVAEVDAGAVTEAVPGAQTPDLTAEPALPRAEPAPQAAVPVAETDMPVADTTPSSAPVIAPTDAGLAAPSEGAALAVVPATDTPVLPNPQAPAPQTPASEADLVLSTEPAPPPVKADPVPEEPIAVIPVIPVIPEGVPDSVPEAVPEVVPDSVAAPAPVPEAVAQPVPEAIPDSGTDAGPAPATPVAPAEPRAPVAPNSTAGLAAADPVVDQPIDAASQTAPVVSAPVAPAPEPPPPPTPDPAPQPGPEILPQPHSDPALVPVPEVITLTPDTAQTAPPPARIVLQGDAAILPQVAGGVRVNRPDTASPAGPVPEVATDPAAGSPDADFGPALVRFAAPFDNPDGRPLLAVILVDDGAIAGMAATLAGVPFPVTVAINPGDPDATARMQTYRDMGIEVLAVANLPQGAQPSDVEVTLESVFGTLPQALGLLDTGDGGVQSDAAVTGQTLARLGADGRGLVLKSAGLNPALRAAATADVPAVEIYRDLDSDGQDAGTIRRFLDNAAFQARQQSGIVLLARLRPETISALILWGSENRAGQVALAPISAVLSQ